MSVKTTLADPTPDNEKETDAASREMNSQFHRVPHAEWRRVIKRPSDAIVDELALNNGMAATYVGNDKILCVGGESAPLSALRSFDIAVLFDTNTFQHFVIKQKGDVPPRSSWGQVCAYGDNIYSWGGICRPEECWWDDMYVTSVVQANCLTHNDRKLKWRKLPKVQDTAVPQARSSHVFLAMGEGSDTLVLVGGGYWTRQRWSTPKVEMLNDVWTYSPSTNIWTQHEAEGEHDPSDQMSPRWGLTAQRISDTEIMFFGGQDLAQSVWNDDTYILNVQKMRWRKMETRGTPPCGRHGHSASLVNDQFIVIGGWGADPKREGESCYLNDVHSLNLKTLSWQRIITTDMHPALPQEMPSLCGHVATVHNDNIYLCGGLTDWEQRLPNNYTHILRVGPKRLVDMCLEWILGHQEEFNRQLSKGALLPGELVDKIAFYTQVFHPYNNY